MNTNTIDQDASDAAAADTQPKRPPALAVLLPGVVARLTDEHDRATARWRGPVFRRQATAPERAFLARCGALRDPAAARWLMTRVEVRGALRRRAWPTLGGAL